MNLNDLIVPSKTTWVDYPGIPDFEVQLSYLTREELIKIRKKASSNKLNRKTRQVEEDLDSDLFQELYIKAVIKGWKGLTYKEVAKLLPINENAIDDFEAELEYSEDNAIALMKNSPEFDSFISETLDDVSAFTQSNKS